MPCRWAGPTKRQNQSTQPQSFCRTARTLFESRIVTRHSILAVPFWLLQGADSHHDRRHDIFVGVIIFTYVEDNIKSLEPYTAFLFVDTLIQIKGCLPLLPRAHDSNLGLDKEKMSCKISEIGESGYPRDSRIVVCIPHITSPLIRLQRFADALVPSRAVASKFVEFDSQFRDQRATASQNVKREAWYGMGIGAICLSSNSKFNASEGALNVQDRRY